MRRDGEEMLAPSIEVCYGPHTSIDAAWAAICRELYIESEEDYKYIPIGLTVGVQNGDTIKEYWFCGGHDRAHLVEKNTGGDVEDDAVEGSQKPITSGAVHKIVGDITSVLSTL